MENTLLNLIPAAYLPEIHLSQYDVGRTITFTLKDGASDYSVPSGASVKVKATKPSGFGFEVACTFNGGTVTLVTTDTMTPENGRFPAELSIVSGNTTIGTSNFIFNIERSPHPEGTIDGDAETIIPELTLLVERIEAAAEDVDEKAELFLNLSAEAETLPAGSLATANYSDGVLTLGIPRGYDGDDTKADAIVKSASGDIASFSDGGNGLLVKSLNVNIVPKQSGSGDPSPSNVRPISGYSEVKTTVAGENILDINAFTVGTINANTGQEMASNTRIRSDYIPLKAGTYTISSESGFNNVVDVYSLDKVFLLSESYAAWSSGSERQFTLSGDRYVRILFQKTNQTAITPADVTQGQLIRGTIATPYIPYNGTTYTTSLGQTVYGGTLDVVSGVLTITKGIVDLGSINWSKLTATGNYRTYFYTSLNAIPNANGNGTYLSAPTNSICSDYTMRKRSELTVAGNTVIGIDIEGGTVYIADTSKDSLTASAFKTAMNGVQLVYELATPTEIQLTPTQVKTLLGNNNIWADSGTVEVEYRADTTLAYNELLSLIASLS